MTTRSMLKLPKIAWPTPFNYMISCHIDEVKQEKQFAYVNVVKWKRSIQFIPAIYSLLVILSYIVNVTIGSRQIQPANEINAQ